MSVLTGVDVLVRQRFERLRGARLGLIVNPTSVDRKLRSLVDLLMNSPGTHVSAILGPEHGYRAEAQDMIGVGADVGSGRAVPIHSLYGSTFESLSPAPEMLDGLDLLIFDVQDVGSRYYTFAATMKYAMIAASKRGLRFMVLDRPNPIGGERIEGPSVHPGYNSFVSAHPLPIRHGMTVGELARMYRDEEKLDLDLTVVPCEGWSRSMRHQDTGLPWIAPSPNMATPETAEVYPGGCLVEGTNLSEGRGTTHPFEWWGAPWFDAENACRELRAAFADSETVLGAYLRTLRFKPTFHKHAGEECRGIQPHVENPREFRPVALYTLFLSLARRAAAERFAWRTETYEFVSDPIAIDLLFGSSREREMIDAGTTVPELLDFFAGAWSLDEKDFRARRRPYLLYPETDESL